jgi:regulator of nucleoside diphosphate kinase
MMGSIAITQFDFARLEKLVNRLRTKEDLPTVAKALEDELDRANVVDPREVPADVVTMNSRATVRDLVTGDVESVRLVFPGAAAPRKGAISVLAPLGLALLGTRAGDEVSWEVPGFARRLRVETVTYQPEAAGRFDL